MRIFSIIDRYLPGYASGGPLRTLAALADQLRDDFEFWIFTRDRDRYDDEPFPGVAVDSWNTRREAMVYYSSPQCFSVKTAIRLIKESRPEVVYLNSFFHPVTLRFLVARRAGGISDIPVILAPRGEFSPGALKKSQRKKSLYIQLTSRLGLYEGLLWQASTDMEASEIRAAWPRKATIHVAPDAILLDGSGISQLGSRAKQPGAARFVHVARITSKKNLLFALRMLRNISGEATFHIYGPIEDQRYWDECLAEITRLPHNITVSHEGALPHERILETLQHYDFFLFPTLGENFGHSIAEALRAGCPVLVSDQTPWRGLTASQSGWDIPLSDEARWGATIKECIDMETATYQRMSNAAQQHLSQWLASSETLAKNRALFRRAKTLITAKQ